MCLCRDSQAGRAREVVQALSGQGCQVQTVLAGGAADGAEDSITEPIVRLRCGSRMQRWLAGFTYRRALYGSGDPVLWIAAAELFSIAYGADYSAIVYDVDEELLPGPDDGMGWYDHETLLGEAHLVVTRDAATHRAVLEHLHNLPRSSRVLAPAGAGVADVMAMLEGAGATHGV